MFDGIRTSQKLSIPECVSTPNIEHKIRLTVYYVGYREQTEVLKNIFLTILPMNITTEISNKNTQ